MSIWTVDWPADMTFTEPAEQRQRLLAEAYAGSTLRALTLYRVGGEPITVTPSSPQCRRRTADLYGVLPDEHFRGCWCDHGSCGCADTPHVLLDAPVGRIDEVRIDGVVLPAEAYHVADGNKLVRTDGKSWPSCHGWNFTVTYLNAYPVDIMGSHVGGLLAMEFLKALRGDKKCRLPAGVTSITRAGISMEVKADMFDGGLTGISEVDAWVRQWNPHGQKVRTGVYSVDMEPARRLPMGYRGNW